MKCLLSLRSVWLLVTLLVGGQSLAAAAPRRTPFWLVVSIPGYFLASMRPSGAMSTVFSLAM